MFQATETERYFKPKTANKKEGKGKYKRITKTVDKPENHKEHRDQRETGEKAQEMRG